MVAYTIKNYQSEMLESWLRCRALAYMRSSFQDEITAEKENVSDATGVSLVAIKDQQVIGIAEAIFLNQGQAKAASYGLHEGTVLTTLDTIAVHPDYQRVGIAKALLKQLRSRLKMRGGILLIYTLDDDAANGLYQTIGAKLCYRASIVHGHSSKNHVPEWTHFRVTDDKQVAVYDEHDQEIAYGQDMETYYVGKSENIKQLTDVHKVVTENVYILEL
ncbi:GNAT family N-acetyltransferase [Lacticaseibacillus casei]|uniref:GNAT family N-acetyltransferase n=1 Tax=Lacticaseibacillus huelsenbergensis TaxID=3035291 RepID=A0ABY8DP46_9LACO|nr:MULTISPECIES: GNAT family N-acetyltransferase [Lacticaseibacillus]MDG3061951.1 GNAT family N-acetyltransferase [Lacticaseibacillus sp. BCRC 81376]QVI37986.1 GNAT family N-acetyltransferase [Lacticaseibacillus casei]QXG59774.1 GNAT family N-acetyltransferase [Lacticaseibacillus casei]WFB38758.1 GNAT family N-acetyltransferase [Lacticaseibacillus huelsenbergensis]WFB43153.1 GNAT family N-acetyltransferase [Lacticaseibacillus huelsenbergensis]